MSNEYWELEELADQWEKVGAYTSNLSLLRREPAYDELIAGYLRKDLVRLALSRLHGESRPQWLMFLGDLVDDPPEVPEKSQGVVNEMALLWFKWADERKIPAYCPPDGKPPVTKSGKVLTDLDFHRMSEEAEEGYDVDRLLARSKTTSAPPREGI